MPNRDQSVRCAIYTRKSSDEGLEQEFNSLDAQREACAAFIASQRQEGWVKIDIRYDDGGFSGGTLERPALKQLLADVESQIIDVVVVYKIDRLTRSLMDFARIVEVFDAHTVSFVSVTQQFNTTSSMGRLTLNVLLSFAQFEREVTGERIRDKIAASKKKGMWMGGFAPLGYDPIGRKLVVNPKEAETVRLIYRRYLELGSVRQLMKDLQKRGITSKRRVSAGGKVWGGKPINRGALYHILKNRIYRGEIVHKGSVHPGEHDAIIDETLWDTVQDRLASNAVARQHRSNAKESSLLVGLVVDEAGNRLTPSHAVKAAKRYRYYVSKPPKVPSLASTQTTSLRIPAGDLETIVLSRIALLLQDKDRICALAKEVNADATLVGSALQRADDLSARLVERDKDVMRSMVNALIARVVVTPGNLDIEIDGSALWTLVTSEANAGRSNSLVHPDMPIVLRVSCSLRRAGLEMRLVIGDDTKDRRSPDLTLVRAVVLAQSWWKQLLAGELRSITEIADRTGLTRSLVSRRLGLAFLAPLVVEAILDGRQPASITVEDLCKAVEASPLWSRQRSLLGI